MVTYLQFSWIYISQRSNTCPSLLFLSHPTSVTPAAWYHIFRSWFFQPRHTFSKSSFCVFPFQSSNARIRNKSISDLSFIKTPNVNTDTYAEVVFDASTTIVSSQLLLLFHIPLNKHKQAEECFNWRRQRKENNNSRFLHCPAVVVVACFMKTKQL